MTRERFGSPGVESLFSPFEVMLNGRRDSIEPVLQLAALHGSGNRTAGRSSGQLTG